MLVTVKNFSMYGRRQLKNECQQNKTLNINDDIWNLEESFLESFHSEGCVVINLRGVSTNKKYYIL